MEFVEWRHIRSCFGRTGTFWDVRSVPLLKEVLMVEAESLYC